MSLLVALALGLLVVSAAGAVLVATRRAHGVHDAAARLQETGQLALAVLGAHIRRAGFAERTPDVASRQTFFARFGEPAILGCAGGYFAVLDPVAPADCIADPAGNDALLLRHQALPDPADPFARIPGYLSTTGDGADCLGQNPDASGRVVAASLFRVQGTSLSCMGNGNPGSLQPMFAGIEQLRLRYSVDISGDGSADAHLSADDPYLSSLAGWERVLAVEVCLVARSDEAPASGARVGYTDCAGEARNALDGRLRRTFQAVFQIPNRADAQAMVREGGVP